jgi:hypothetical protein
MSSSGIPVIRIPIRPVGQTTGSWTQQNVAQTYLDKGAYIMGINIAWQITVGSMSTCQCIITQDLPFNSGGKTIMGVKSNQMGTVGATTPNGFCLQNTIYIRNDNTPIYVGTFNSIAGGSTWGVPASAQYDDFVNVLWIAKLN